MRPRLALLLVIAATVGAIAGLWLAANTPAAAAPAAVTPVVFERIDAIPAPVDDVDPQLLAAAFGPGGDYDDAAVAEVRLTADRVCEAGPAGVPFDEQLATLVTSTGMLPDQARAFHAAATAGCTA